MSYTIRYSNLSKDEIRIIVEDNTINTEATSLSFVGKNASNYASAISTNFLHLLENFANEDPPNNPVEGQLWFDTSDPQNKKLRINDSTAGNQALWKPINGLYQQISKPETASAGDIWVDISKSQVFITIDGQNWTLVGPTSSSDPTTGRSGSYPEVIKGADDVDHYVINNYIANEIVEIISKTDFIPKVRIDGFTEIKAGLNISSNNNAKLKGTAYTSENISVSFPTPGVISGNSFVRNDIDSSINGTLNLKNKLTIGADPTFELRKNISDYKNVFYNSSPVPGKFGFVILRDEIDNEIITIDGSNLCVGINNLNPTEALDVVGNVLVNGSLTVTDSLEVSNKATFSNTVELQLPADFVSTATFEKGILIGKPNDGSNQGKSYITPLTSATYNIGSVNSPFKTIYSDVFIGDLFDGVAKVANSLTNATTFEVTGDIEGTSVPFRGFGGTLQLPTTLKRESIANKTARTEVSNDDELLVAVSTTATSGIFKTKKSDFLADIYDQLIPPGTIMPYAGLRVEELRNGPGGRQLKGWLYCDGSVVDKVDYPNLFNAIGTMYGKTSIPTEFRLPDLRGRMLIGFDDMTNGFLSSPLPPGRVPSAVTPDINAVTAGQLGIVAGGDDNPVAVSTSTGFGSTSSGVVTSVMNPYLAINYIIKV